MVSVLERLIYDKQARQAQIARGYRFVEWYLPAFQGRATDRLLGLLEAMISGEA